MLEEGKWEAIYFKGKVNKGRHYQNIDNIEEAIRILK